MSAYHNIILLSRHSLKFYPFYSLLSEIIVYSTVRMEPMISPLVQLVQDISRIAIPIIIVVGVLSNVLNILVLTRPALYQHACSRYFLALAIGNLFYCGVILVYRLLADQYQIDPAKSSNGLCKFIIYAGQLGIFLAPSFIVLASIDRWCISSTNPQLRKFSSIKTARWMIVSNTILFAIIFSNSAIAVDLRDTDPFGCTIRADTLYKQVYVIVQVCIMSVIVPALMAVFGLLTIYNINKARVAPAEISRHRRTGNQLIRMLLLQVGTHIVLILPSSVTYLIYVLPGDIKYRPEFFAAVLFCILPLHVSYITAFFLYVISAQVYRKELIRLFYRIFRPNAQNQVHSLTHTNNTMPMGNRQTVEQ